MPESIASIAAVNALPDPGSIYAKRGDECNKAIRAIQLL